MKLVRAIAVLILACAGCSTGSLVWTGGPVPSRLTIAWYKANFPNCIDFCNHTRENSLWLAIRDRPDFADLLIHVIEDSGTDSWTRSNAILKLGATNQDTAYRYVINRLAALSSSEDATNWVLSLGSGIGRTPAFVYDALIAQLGFPRRIHSAIHALSDGVGTIRARKILEEALLTVPAESRHLIEIALRNWKLRPERE